MSGLTVERLAELRRIAEAATPGPWAWRMSKDGRILDLITLETGYNEEIITPSHINAWLQVKGGLKDFIPAFDPATALALLDEIERLRREREEDDDKWTRYEELYVQARGQIVDLQLEIERLRRERDVLAEAFKHVLTCDDCECASCPEGTGLLYRAYRALGGVLSGTMHDADSGDGGSTGRVE